MEIATEQMQQSDEKTKCQDKSLGPQEITKVIISNQQKEKMQLKNQSE